MMFEKNVKNYFVCVYVGIDYVGGIPLDVLKPVLEKCTPKQLYDLEDYNPVSVVKIQNIWTPKQIVLIIQKFEQSHRMVNSVNLDQTASRSSLIWIYTFLPTPVCLKTEARHDKTNKMSVRPAKTQISLGIRSV